MLKGVKGKINRLTHINKQGRAKMINVEEKAVTIRQAEAMAEVFVNGETFEAIKKGENKKGDVLGTAQVAGIMAAKRTWELIPMCHPLMLTGIDIGFKLIQLDENSEADKHGGKVEITSKVNCTGRTGVEMEALTAVSVAALTIYDMCKSMQKDITIENMHLVEKSGGKSGFYSWSNHA